MGAKSGLIAGGGAPAVSAVEAASVGSSAALAASVGGGERASHSLVGRIHSLSRAARLRAAPRAVAAAAGSPA